MGRRAPTRTYDDLEGELLSSLGPVQPNPEFVQRLKSRLTNEPAIIIERRTEAAVFVFLALALFSGALLVWLVYSLMALLRRMPKSA